MFCFVEVPSKTLISFHGLALGEWASVWVRGQDGSVTEDLLDRGTSRCASKRGQREVAVEFSVPDSEGVLFEVACGCFEHTAEFHVRFRKGYELRVRGKALRLTTGRRIDPDRSLAMSHVQNCNMAKVLTRPRQGMVIMTWS